MDEKDPLDEETLLSVSGRVKRRRKTAVSRDPYFIILILIWGIIGHVAFACASIDIVEATSDSFKAALYLNVAGSVNALGRSLILIAILKSTNLERGPDVKSPLFMRWLYYFSGAVCLVGMWTLVCGMVYFISATNSDLMIKEWTLLLSGALFSVGLWSVVYYIEYTDTVTPRLTDDESMDWFLYSLSIFFCVGTLLIGYAFSFSISKSNTDGALLTISQLGLYLSATSSAVGLWSFLFFALYYKRYDYSVEPRLDWLPLSFLLLLCLPLLLSLPVGSKMTLSKNRQQKLEKSSLLFGAKWPVLYDRTLTVFMIVVPLVYSIAGFHCVLQHKPRSLPELCRIASITLWTISVGIFLTLSPLTEV